MTKTWAYIVTLHDTKANRMHTSIGLKKFAAGSQKVHMIRAVIDDVVEKRDLSPDSVVLFYQLEEN